tara:strand:- start:444 stop:941 length:498 start_codon:yes stop_codon:yes gene_type:complete
MKVKIFCDGSNFVGRGSGSGVHVEQAFGPNLNEWRPTARFLVPLPPKSTNNEAEYHAVIGALKYLQTGLGGPVTRGPLDVVGLMEVIIYSDSQLVIRQINGEYKVKEPRLQELHNYVQYLRNGLINNFTSNVLRIDFKYLPREENTDADRLARIASMLSPTHSNG